MKKNAARNSPKQHFFFGPNTLQKIVNQRFAARSAVEGPCEGTI